MTGSMLEMKVQGDQKIVKAFDKLKSPEERAALLEGIGAYGVSSTQQRFLDKKAPDGQPWKPSLRAKESGGQTLRNSARLFQSFSFEASKDSAAWGTNVVYAGIHQFGGVIKPKSKKALAFHLANGQFVLTKQVTIPARPFLGIDEHDKTRIGDIAATWMKGAVT